MGSKTHTKQEGKSSSSTLGAKLKKRIRDVERLLKRDTLNGTTRTENERRLKALKVELTNSQLNLKAKKNAKKYHMVRFFEKKKAIRKLKQAMKAQEEAIQRGERKEIKKARKSVRFCEIDVVYTIMFPKSEKYISLYPNAKDEDDSTKLSPQAKTGQLASDTIKREKRKEYANLIELNKLPFTLEDALAGKTISLDTERLTAKSTTEIDAPEQQQQQRRTKKDQQEKEHEEEEEEEDEFLEAA